MPVLGISLPPCRWGSVSPRKPYSQGSSALGGLPPGPPSQEVCGVAPGGLGVEQFYI